jgi:muramoyltetrapeptide carboxypeptidase
MTRPPRVADGSTVGVVSTSAPVSKDQLDQVIGYFESCGHPVKVGAHTLDDFGYLAGSREDRLADLEAMFRDPDVSLIVPANGGKGAAGLLDGLDYDLIRANPKVFTGISDPAALCNGLAAAAGLHTLHGPSGVDFSRRPVNSQTMDAFWDMVRGPIAGKQIADDTWRHYRLAAGQHVNGPAIGGHLGTIQALIGTPWMPPLAGAVLFVEEVAVPWMRIDAMLTHLRLAGVLDAISALVVGTPVECEQGDALDASLDDLILRCVPDSLPVITGVDFGHTPRKIPFVVGARIEISANDPGATVTYLDDFVA